MYVGDPVKGLAVRDIAVALVNKRGDTYAVVRRDTHVEMRELRGGTGDREVSIVDGPYKGSSFILQWWQVQQYIRVE